MPDRHDSGPGAVRSAAAYPPFLVAEDFERLLGDPTDETVEFSYARCLELDEREAFPAAICRMLEQLRLHHYYVPDRYGGRLSSYEVVLQLVRLLARRDLTVAIGHCATFLGAVSAWVGARDEQARRLAREVLDGTPMSWGLTERQHGSDLLAGDLVAVRDDDGFRLRGEKWLINNATRARIVSVLARTADAGDPRGFDVLLLDKAHLAPGHFTCLPKVRTHGIRGADISGIVCEDVRVPLAAQVGSAGSGIEIVLKGLQLTRTMCAGLAIGATDQALRIAVGWARDHRTDEGRLLDLPPVRRILVDAYTELLGAEALAIAAARSIHHHPAELSVISAVVKVLAPTRLQAAVGSLGTILGSAAMVTDDPTALRYDKIMRDGRLIGLFDGNTVVNLNAIIHQFPNLVRGFRRGAEWPDSVDTHDLTREVPAFDPGRLNLIARGGATVVRALPALVSQLGTLAQTRPELASTLHLASRLEESARALHEHLSDLRPVPGPVPSHYFDAAARWSLCYLGSTALAVWLATHPHANQLTTSPIWRDAVWLDAVLGRTLASLGDPPAPDAETDDTLLTQLLAQEHVGDLFSLLPCRLSESRGGR
ncbi:acyl-CoA dehydrogenase family protein [Rugosimonospora africana]|uniref:Acyl-CoA dehydrogenase n=1 Tax=Rugosimonospora africana TaxID=556532 RepID=A0A8J3R1R9_9ACTN|nr:acyl-CoA dehydrogenase [Rugosimonospora africana]GIH21405.1 acyl-CoA dehydrogenase [Rugosimonospora africana]